MAEEHLGPDEMNRLLFEVVTHVPLAESLLPDTELVRQTRFTLEREVAELEARGQTIEIPRL